MKLLIAAASIFVASAALAADGPDDVGFCFINGNNPPSVPSTRADCPASRGVFIQPGKRPLGFIPK